MTDTPIQIAERAPSRLFRESESIRQANLRLKLEPDCANAASLRRWVEPALENQRRQLIERVGGLNSEQNKPCNHHVEAEMHEELATNCLLWRVDRRQGCEQNSTRNGNHDCPENIHRHGEQKASAAAEVMRSSRTFRLKASCSTPASSA